MTTPWITFNPDDDYVTVYANDDWHRVRIEDLDDFLEGDTNE